MVAVMDKVFTERRAVDRDEMRDTEDRVRRAMDAIASSFRACGMPHDEATGLAEAASVALAKEFDGERVYFNSYRKDLMAARNARIGMEYDGTDMCARRLGNECGIRPDSVKRIAAEERRKKRRPLSS